MADVLTLRPVSPRGATVRVNIAGLAEPSGGVGGWLPIDRPRRASAVEWTGTPGRELRVPIVVNGMERQGAGESPRDVSVENQIARLEALGRPVEASGQPPVLAIEGPVPHRKLRYVLADIEWGEYSALSTGARSQQYATLVFGEYAAADVLLTPARRKKTPKRARTVVVVKQDLPQGLARVSARTDVPVATLKRLNGIRDPRKIRVGQTLKLS